MLSAMRTPVTSSRVLLVVDRRGTPTPEAHMPMRRFRLVRLRFDEPAVKRGGRFAYLKQPHD
jgi:hypothetical protein